MQRSRICVKRRFPYGHPAERTATGQNLGPHPGKPGGRGQAPSFLDREFVTQDGRSRMNGECIQRGGAGSSEISTLIWATLEPACWASSSWPQCPPAGNKTGADTSRARSDAATAGALTLRMRMR
eukprot:3672478-Pyramimonas_sp.AAC.1